MSTSRYSPACSSPVRTSEPHCGITEAPRPSDLDDLGMVGEGAAMQRLRLQVRRIGPHFRAVLVGGEPGTGKELAARALHTMSRGAEGPFVVCDAATLESADGDDSPAASDRISWLMHKARQGTLFLDGIGEMPLEAQAQLLRVLRRYEWAQEGVAAPQGIGTRIIASTNQDLRVLASTGRLLVRLYPKIAMVGITLPPLRERVEGIEELAMHFLGRFARLYEKRVDTISDDAIERLKGDSWPGNVREMEDFVRGGVLESEGAVLDLPPFAETGADAGVAAGIGQEAGVLGWGATQTREGGGAGVG